LSQADDQKISIEGHRFLNSKLADFIQAGSQGLLPEPVLHHLLYVLECCAPPPDTDPDPTSAASTQSLRQSVLKALQQRYPKSHVSRDVVPQLYGFGNGLDFMPNQGDEQSGDPNLSHGNISSILRAARGTLKAWECMRDAGYSCTSSSAACKQTLDSFAPLSEQDVCNIMIMMANNEGPTVDDSLDLSSWLTISSDPSDHSVDPVTDSSGSGLTGWNVLSFAHSLKKLSPELNWLRVFASIDQSEVVLRSREAYRMFIAMCPTVSFGARFPVAILLGQRWRHPLVQLSTLAFALDSDISLLDLTGTTTISPDDALVDLSRRERNLSSIGKSLWVTMDAFAVLLDLSTSSDATVANRCRDTLGSVTSDHILLVVARLTSGAGILKVDAQVRAASDLTTLLLPQFFSAPPSSMSWQVLSKAWSYNPAMFVDGLVRLHNSRQATAGAIVNILQVLKALQVALSADYSPAAHAFALDIACVAARRDFVHLEKWLVEAIQTRKLPFMQVMIDFLRLAASRGDSTDSADSEISSPEILALLLRTLHSSAPVMTPPMVDDFKQTSLSVVQALPKVQALLGDQTQREPFAAEVEDEANAMFKKIFASMMTIEQAIAILQRLKDSTIPFEQDIYQCMIQSLFEEFNHFPRYPEKELRIAGVLFGQLIQNQLLNRNHLSLALRTVFEALRKPVPNPNMFKFGLYALDQFKSQLVALPQYRLALLQLPALKAAHPALYSQLEAMSSTGPQSPSPPPQLHAAQIPGQGVQMQMFSVNPAASFAPGPAMGGQSASPSPSPSPTPVINPSDPLSAFSELTISSTIPTPPSLAVTEDDHGALSAVTSALSTPPESTTGAMSPTTPMNSRSPERVRILNPWLLLNELIGLLLLLLLFGVCVIVIAEFFAFGPFISKHGHPPRCC
jgi:hypothetical protein